jgi:hypothetical protein
VTPREAREEAAYRAVLMLTGEVGAGLALVRLLEQDGFTVARTQDARDGEALRLLREGLRQGYDLTVSFTWMSSGCSVDVWRHGSPKYAVSVQGPTLAEAADACREAMP